MLTKPLVFLALIASALAFACNGAEALQQTAGPMLYELQPGQTKTLQWGLVSDEDTPVTLALRVEGPGSELVSLPETVDLGPSQSRNVDIVVTVPADYQNDVMLAPAIYATQFGETGGQTVFNIEMRKVLTIKIGNPAEAVTAESVSAAPTAAQAAPQAAGSAQEKEAAPENDQPLMIGEEEPLMTGEQVDEEPQVDPEPQSTVQEQEKGGCLIATAAFGSELAPQVQLLREVRDNVLLGTGSGAGFMSAFNAVYYSFSPTVADWERDSPVFKQVVRAAITPMLATLSILNYADIDSEAEMLGYGIGIILLNAGMYFAVPALVIMRIGKKI